MSQNQNLSSKLFIDYIPAELRENKTWRIVYYVKNPFTEKLEAKRVRVKPLKSITARRKLAKVMINNINSRLQSGWNPFYQNKGTKELTTIADAIAVFLNRTKRDYEDGELRYDSYKTYKSQCQQLLLYLTKVENTPDLMCYKLNEEFVNTYLDYVRYIKGLSARTRDNYLGFLGTLCSFLLAKKYITANPTVAFSKTNKKAKNRVLITKKQRLTIFEYWKKNNPNYLTICMVCYYCLIRRTEITKLKVEDVSLINGTIYIDESSSKSRKGKHVTIPDALMQQLAFHIKSANNLDYLFSTDNFKPGDKILHPDRITKNWAKMREDLNFKNTIQWYSLKDSGITDLLGAGVPLIYVRDQARHENSKQTDMYTPRKILKANENIKTANL